MDIVYLFTGIVLAVIMFNGVWMSVNARPPIVRLGRHSLHLPETATAGRWVGAAQIVGGARGGNRAHSASGELDQPCGRLHRDVRRGRDVPVLGNCLVA